MSEENNTSTSELQEAKREAELAKKEAELAKKEAELARKEAESAKNNPGKGKGGKKKVVLIVVLAIVILALAAVIIFLLLRKGTASVTKDDTVPNTIVTKDNVDEVMKDLDKEMTPVGSYELSMTTTWNFKNGSAISKDAFIENVETNPNSVYATIEIADTGEQIYKSPVLQRGSHVENIKLDAKLKKGTYDCVCTYHILNDAETDETSSTRVTMTVIVKK